MIKCWCGSDMLDPFSPLYLRCQACDTLVLNDVPIKDVTHITDDENDLYGRNYYLKRLVEQYGFPPIETRARRELSERCLYWLRTLLKYKLPPAKVLELGSSHGGFVAMMRWAGYDATGLELSPWLVELARSTFGVPMLSGPIEDQAIGENSLDAIVLMDVLEHLPDPLNTVKKCISLLKPDGILLVQTPKCPEDGNYEQMLSDHSPFLEQLKYDEHIYLFTERSVQSFFDRLNIGNINFEPAIFSHYDMFFVAGRSPFALQTSESISAALSVVPDRRLIQAMLDLDDSRESLFGTLGECEADRAARLAVIQRQEREFSERLRAGEADREARLEVIRNQGETIGRQSETIKQLEERIEQQEEAIKQREETIRQQEEAIKQQGETIRQQDIVQHDIIEELDEIRNSTIWKMTGPLRQLSRKARDSDDKSREDNK